MIKPYQDIVWLEIPVHFPFSIHVAHSFDELPEQLEHIGFFDPFFHEVSQGAIGTELHENVDTIVVLLEAIVAHDVGVNE